MTAPESTAITLTGKGIGSLPPEIRMQIELRRMLNLAAAELGKLNWGEKLEESTRRSVAEWGRRFNVDVATEIDVLGNKIYPNAKYYLRRLGELIESGIVEYAYADHVHAEERLKGLGDEGTKEAARRLAERCKYNIPEDAEGAVVFRVKLTSMEQEVVGVNWAGDPGRTKIGHGGAEKKGKEADPIGFLEPAKTAESRAARRCLRQLVAHVPKVSNEIEVMMAEVKGLEGRIQVDHDTLKAQGPERAPTPIATPSDPYLAPPTALAEPPVVFDRQASLELDQKLAEEDDAA